MSSPDTRGTKTPKRHPACPGKRGCQLPGCIHNAQSSTCFSTHDSYQLNRLYPSVKFAGPGGLLYQRLGASPDVKAGIVDEPNATVSTMVYIVHTKIKIREVSGIILEKIRSCMSTQMPM